MDRWCFVNLGRLSASFCDCKKIGNKGAQYVRTLGYSISNVYKHVYKQSMLVSVNIVWP